MKIRVSELHYHYLGCRIKRFRKVGVTINLIMLFVLFVFVALQSIALVFIGLVALVSGNLGFWITALMTWNRYEIDKTIPNR